MSAGCATQRYTTVERVIVLSLVEEGRKPSFITAPGRTCIATTYKQTTFKESYVANKEGEEN
jgi:hypothetical protein